MTVTINTGEDERSKIFAMTNDFRSMSGVKAVGTGNCYPGNVNINLNLFSVESRNGNVDKAIECYGVMNTTSARSVSLWRKAGIFQDCRIRCTV